MSQRLSQIPTDARSECFYRASGLVYAREGVLLAGCKSLSELATAP